jgi:hypothetical protein
VLANYKKKNKRQIVFFFQASGFDTLLDLESVGHVIYTHFVLQFVLVGLILFVSLVGVVFLTVLEKKKRKRLSSFPTRVLSSNVRRTPKKVLKDWHSEVNRLELQYNYD